MPSTYKLPESVQLHLLHLTQGLNHSVLLHTAFFNASQNCAHIATRRHLEGNSPVAAVHLSKLILLLIHCMSLKIQKLSKLSMLLISTCNQNYQYTFIVFTDSFPLLYEEVEFLLSQIVTMSWVLEFRSLQGEGSARVHHPPWLACHGPGMPGITRTSVKNISSSSTAGARKVNGSEETWQIGEQELFPLVP